MRSVESDTGSVSYMSAVDHSTVIEQDSLVVELYGDEMQMERI